jgi:hypothetical protein
LNSFDRLFWTLLRRFWPRWSNVLVIVKPDTVVSWHRAGFRLYWRWRSRRRGGRPRVTDENVSNTPHFSNARGNVSAGGFLAITSALSRANNVEGGERQYRVALKVTF